MSRERGRGGSEKRREAKENGGKGRGELGGGR